MEPPALEVFRKWTLQIMIGLVGMVVFGQRLGLIWKTFFDLNDSMIL